MELEFYLPDYEEKAQWANENGYYVEEIECNETEIIDDIEQPKRKFRLVQCPDTSAEDARIATIIELKERLQKYKEDVEQVELFGMQRDDYAEKKQLCASIILQLRELEKSEV